MAHPRTQVKALEGKYVQGQAKLALLLQAACGYRAAHAIMQQDLWMLSPGEPLTAFDRDKADVEARARALRSAQVVLFAAIDVVEEEAGGTPETKAAPPK